jgi:hypothetical protein
MPRYLAAVHGYPVRYAGTHADGGHETMLDRFANAGPFAALFTVMLIAVIP